MRVKQKCNLETMKCCGHIKWSHCEGPVVGGIHPRPRMKLSIPFPEPLERVPSTFYLLSPFHPHFGPRNGTSHKIIRSYTQRFDWLQSNFQRLRAAKVNQPVRASIR